MYRDKTVCVVVPAYNEEKLIGRVLETMPDYVDKVVVVDDKSTDKTAEIAINAAESFSFSTAKTRAWAALLPAAINGHAITRLTSLRLWPATLKWTPRTCRIC
jgi:cellulose synthase/poly-beta-1,6-N-acetylglucosamine synthase-like glycosyltransferase